MTGPLPTAKLTSCTKDWWIDWVKLLAPSGEVDEGYAAESREEV
jgi:hypothetical protein